ncbi:MAG: methyltransferase domain-containing protein [Pseudobdellovibrionaceae bacterium]|nr:methyltransferase domain-containing protein [Bdellovibrionales bacterium]USN46767.1 MAG: methyltransferase domain-containing protein [Pseudobdellovibrionaceae bacterium]
MDTVIHDKSMWPLIEPGDHLALEFFESPQPIESFSEGEILLLRDSSEWIAHRVHNRNGQKVTKGDRSRLFDDPELLAWGKVTGTWRRGKKFYWGEKPHELNKIFVYLSKIRTPRRTRVARGLLNGLLYLSYMAFRWVAFGKHLSQSLKRAGFFLKLLLSPQDLKRVSDSTVRQKYSSEREVWASETHNSRGFDPGEYQAVEDWRVKTKKPCAKVMVVGCGAGRECWAFESLGMTVTGVDISTSMIERAKESAKKINSTCQFLEGSVFSISPDRKFDLIYLSSGMINHISGKKRRIEFLKACGQRLEKGGWLLLSAEYKPAKRSAFVTIMSGVLKLKFGKQIEVGDTFRAIIETHSNSEELVFWHRYSSKEDVEVELKNTRVFESGQTAEPFFLWQSTTED